MRGILHDIPKGVALDKVLLGLYAFIYKGFVQS